MCGAGDHQSTRSTWKSVRRRSEERAATQRRRGANTAPTEANSLGKMDSLDDAGEKKKRTFPNSRDVHVQKARQEQSQLQARKEHSQQQAEAHVSARDHSRLSLRTGARRSTSIL